MPEKNFIHPAERIAHFKPYFFAQLNKNIIALRAEGKDVIRLDMGSPDLAPPAFIIDSLIHAAQNPDLQSYAPMGGTIAYKQAGADYYLKRFNVALDPENEVLGLIGSKEGLFHLTQSILNPGDTVILPNPGYPVYRASAKIAGAEIAELPLTPEKEYKPDFSVIPESTAKKAKLMWLNYPNNPTGAIAELDTFEEAVAYCRKYEILLAHDAPYCDITFDGFKAPSVLQVSGAKDVAVEFNSLSKTYNMAGWRLGFLVGNKDVVNIVHTYKSQVDTSTFIPLMVAAATALKGNQSWLEERNLIYQNRRDITIEALQNMGLEVVKPKAAFYLWVKIPANFLMQAPSATRCCVKLEYPPLLEAILAVMVMVIFVFH